MKDTKNKILVPLILFIGAIGYTIRGGSHKIFTAWWAAHTDADKFPGSRVIGILVMSFGFASYVLANHLNPWLILEFPVGTYLTVLIGWGSVFNTRTLAESFGFFIRMLLGVALYLPMALIVDPTWHGALQGLLATVAFAFGSAVIYTISNKTLMVGHQDADWNWNELIEGIWVLFVSLTLLNGI